MHTCSFENHASQRRRGALFQKSDENSVEKSGLNRINTNGTVDGTRNAHPRGPKKQKYTFLQWISQILICDGYRQHGIFSVTLGGRMTFFEDFAYMQLSKLCFPLKAGSTISKKCVKIARRRCVEP